MRSFAYIAYTTEGRRKQGVIVADDESAAARALGARGLSPSEINAKPTTGTARRSFLTRRRIDPDMLSVFTRQIAVLLSAGLAVDAAMEAVQSAAGSPAIEALAAQTRARLMEGDPLAQALKSASPDLPPFYIAAIRAGEHSGELAAVFDTLADHMESGATDRAAIASALIYPIFVTLVAVLVAGILMVTVAPEIVAMFDASGQALPPLTQNLLAVVDVIKDYWPLFLAAFAGLVALALAFARVPHLRHKRDRVLLRVPMIGRFMRMGAAAQYLRTLALMIRARLPLVEALDHASDVLAVERFTDEARAAGEGLRRGDTLSSVLAGLSFLHPVARQLMEAGEASARLAPMSERAATLAETWARTERKRLASLLEPLSMVMVGGMVLVIVLAILLPIFDMQAMVGG